MRPVTDGYGDCSRLSASASNLLTAGSEIAAGRIALFSHAAETAWNGFCCSRVCGTRRCGLSTPESVSLAFTRHPRSMQLGLSSRPETGPATVLPCHFDQLLTCTNETLVPKGRLELPWVAPLRPERSASAISPLRRSKVSSGSTGADPGTRTPDLLFTKQLLYQLS